MYVGRNNLTGDVEISYRGTLGPDRIGTSEHLVALRVVNPNDGVTENSFRLVIEVVPALDNGHVSAVYRVGDDEVPEYQQPGDPPAVFDKVPVLGVALMGGLAEGEGTSLYEGDLCLELTQLLDGETNSWCGSYDKLTADRGDDTRLPLDLIAPNGLRGGGFAIETWLPDENTARPRYTFHVAGGLEPPRVKKLQINTTNGKVRFTADIPASGRPIVDAECFVNGKRRDCVKAGGIANRELRLGKPVPDKNRVRIVLIDDAGNIAVANRTVKGPFRKTGKVKLAGVAKAGKQLVAKLKAQSPKPTRTRYRWLRDGKAIPGARKRKYRLQAADVGKRISVEVVIGRSGYANTKLKSPARRVAAAR